MNTDLSHQLRRAAIVRVRVALGQSQLLASRALYAAAPAPLTDESRARHERSIAETEEGLRQIARLFEPAALRLARRRGQCPAEVEGDEDADPRVAARTVLSADGLTLVWSHAGLVRVFASWADLCAELDDAASALKCGLDPVCNENADADTLHRSDKETLPT
ncbi:MAG: hypothetical protein Q8N17_15570 [Burkholderiaceae bacterium]|nr:hypothetical protein [Burkholderiaceae bacterium]